MTKACEAMLRMLSFNIRTRMIDDQRRRYAAGLIGRDEFEEFVRDVLSVEDKMIKESHVKND